MHRFDAVIVLALAIGFVFFVRNHWRNRVRSEGVAG
jgi:hypothetical protein